MDILAIGEPLCELSSSDASPDDFTRRLGGDTLNAAIYLARLRPDLRIGYMSRLGDDWMSSWMRQAIAAEGIDVSAIAAEPGGSPGLSFIRTGANGERDFLYWRDRTPARRMFSEGEGEIPALDGARCILLSGIVLAILPDAARERLLAALERRRREGCHVVFDTNYRPALWSGPAEAREWTCRMLAIATHVMPSLDDVAAIFGSGDADAALAACAEHARGEVVLTTGGGPVLCRTADGVLSRIDLPPPVAARDTTAAGDSFNAGFLSARLRGAPLPGAVLAGARLAARVVQFPGAIIPSEMMREEVLLHAV